MKVLGKCQLQEVVQEKGEGLNSSGTLSCLIFIPMLEELISYYNILFKCINY